MSAQEDAIRGLVVDEILARVRSLRYEADGFSGEVIETVLADCVRVIERSRRGRKQCAHCLANIEQKRGDIKYCSPACKQAAYRARGVR